MTAQRESELYIYLRLTGWLTDWLTLTELTIITWHSLLQRSYQPSAVLFEYFMWGFASTFPIHAHDVSLEGGVNFK
jgi:hypothetical protein